MSAAVMTVVVFGIYGAASVVGCVAYALVIEVRRASRIRAFRSEQRRQRLLLERLDRETWGS